MSATVASLSFAACPKSLSVVTDTKYTHVVFVSDQPSDLSVVLKYAQLHLSGYGRFLSSHFQLMMGRNSNVFQAGRGPSPQKEGKLLGLARTTHRLAHGPDRFPPHLFVRICSRQCTYSCCTVL
jgi:hypothetical protein